MLVLIMDVRMALSFKERLYKGLAEGNLGSRVTPQVTRLPGSLMGSRRLRPIFGHCGYDTRKERF